MPKPPQPTGTEGNSSGYNIQRNSSIGAFPYPATGATTASIGYKHVIVEETNYRQYITIRIDPIYIGPTTGTYSNSVNTLIFGPTVSPTYVDVSVPISLPSNVLLNSNRFYSYVYFTGNATSTFKDLIRSIGTLRVDYNGTYQFLNSSGTTLIASEKLLIPGFTVSITTRWS